MKNQKLISRNVIRRFQIGGYTQPTNVYNAMAPVAGYSIGKLISWPFRASAHMGEHKEEVVSDNSNQNENIIPVPEGKSSIIKKQFQDYEDIYAQNFQTGKYEFQERKHRDKINLDNLSEQEIEDLMLQGKLPQNYLDLKKHNNKQKSSTRSSSEGSQNTTATIEQQTPETKQYSELEKAVGMKGFLNLLTNGYNFTTAVAIINGSSPSQLLELYDKTSNLFTKPKEEVKPKEEKKEQEITTPVRTIPYNRADIRSLIRNGGYNPYSDYSAGQRKRLRKYLNKEDNQQYEDWMAPFIVFKKKGGRLLPRNIVTKFRNKI